MNNTLDQKTKYLIGGIIGTGLFFFGSVLYAIILSIDFASRNGVTADPNNDKYFMSIFQYLSYVPFLIFSVFWFKDEFAREFKDFKNNFKKYALTIVVIFVVMMFVNMFVNLIYSMLGITGASENENLINDILLSNAAIPMIISVCIMAPVAEELLFRKMLIGVCEKTFNFKPEIAICISAVIFAFIHVSDLENLKFIFQYLPMAFAICLCYHLTNNNIYAAIFIHAINNILAVLSTYTMI